MAQQLLLSDAFEAGFFEALGRVVVQYGRLEYEMKLAVKRLSGLDFTEGFLHAENIQKIGPICDQAKELYAQREPDPTRQQNFSELLDEVRYAWEETRNDVIHACWTAQKNGVPLKIRPKLHRVSKSHRTVKWDRTVSVSRYALLRLAEQVGDVTGKIHRMTTDLPPASAKGMAVTLRKT